MMFLILLEPVESSNLKVADKEKELLKYYPGTAKAT